MGALCATLLVCGCARREYLSIRKAPRNPLAGPLELLSYSGPKPSDRTEQLLRRYALSEQMAKSPKEALQKLQDEIQREPTPEKIYAYAELAYVQGKRSDSLGDKTSALNYFGASVAHAYLYLFDPHFDQQRNFYDPQFRGACDVYNAALEGALRITAEAGLLKPGTTQQIAVGDRQYAVHIGISGKWRSEDFERLEFVSEYEVQGLNNRHHTFGLGVPLIAVRNNNQGQNAAEQFYPPGLSFPVTAFLRVAHADAGNLTCVLELHDPLVSNTVEVGNRVVPLETDVSTALAFFLDHRKLNSSEALATLGLLNPSATSQLTGLYMLEPYDPERIPVIMVHGLWSSPLTWMDMFNDLRSFPEVRENYQFWFYMYPTGQPFWVSAARLRDDLAHAQATLDPHRLNPKLNQLVLVGHSMGGLVSRMQTVESGEAFWQLVSDRPFNEVRGRDEERDELARLLFFRPNPSVRRVITIGTPHDGSHFANQYTQWLARQLITLPNMLVQANQQIVRDNPGVFRNTDFLTITTSIDSLAPDSPVLPVLRSRQTAPWVRHHNIVGLAPSESFFTTFSGEGDGVVSLTSAQFDAAQSELAVPAHHSTVHQHPKSILEVRRVLLEHLQQSRRETVMQGASPGPPVRYAAPGPFPPPAVR